MVQLYLTDKGRALHEQAKALPACILKASGLSLEQLASLKEELVELRSHLQQSL